MSRSHSLWRSFQGPEILAEGQSERVRPGKRALTLLAEVKMLRGQAWKLLLHGERLLSAEGGGALPWGCDALLPGALWTAPARALPLGATLVVVSALAMPSSYIFKAPSDLCFEAL